MLITYSPELIYAVATDEGDRSAKSRGLRMWDERALLDACAKYAELLALLGDVGAKEAYQVTGKWE